MQPALFRENCLLRCKSWLADSSSIHQQGEIFSSAPHAASYASYGLPEQAGDAKPANRNCRGKQGMFERYTEKARRVIFFARYEQANLEAFTLRRSFCC
jgi:hypothetical protein